MVKLSFTVNVYEEFEKVWLYFSNFANITSWDPNTRKCIVKNKTEEEVGSEYLITTVFNEKESDVLYKTMKFTKSENVGYINLFGQNDMITADDEITCRRKGPKETEVEYRADICLRGLAKLATVFIVCDLHKITEQSRVGLRDKARSLWGKAE